jgi:RNA methyltransferase, TrmH family
MIRLTGSQNPLVKEIRALKNKGGREETGRYFIEGVRFVAEALKERIHIRYLMVSETFLSDVASEELLGSAGDGVDCYMLPDSLFASISDTQAPQGILAVLEIRKEQLEHAELNGGLLVLLEGIKDPGNMGTIIRTADAAGCEGVVVPAGCVDIYNPKVLRSTMGSIFHIPVYHCSDIEAAVKTVHEKGYKICASHLDGASSIYKADLTGPVALVIGSEAEGVGEETVKAADMLLKIPMSGRAESLNASVAAGIMIFETMRQRNSKQ